MNDLRRRRRKLGWLMAALVWVLFASGAQAANQVPQVDQPLVPESAIPGGASFTLTVNGAGFVPGAKVYWNGSSLQTNYVTSIQLTAKVSAANIKVAGTASVTVVNPTPGGGASNAVFFEITQPTVGTALSGSTAPVASNPNSVVAADLNADGRQDLAVANELSNTVSVLLGNGDGTFQPPVDYATGVNPQDVVAADFNGDGNLDLAVTNSAANTVSILLGNGNGTFQTHVDYATSTLPVRVVTGDFNRDGALDLAVVDQVTNAVSILLGNGDGTFQSHVDYSVGSEPTALVACDFNGDSILDLAVANFASSTVSVLLGLGDGTFPTIATYATDTGPYGLAAADLNQDGAQDLAVAEFTTSQVSLLPGLGNGTFGGRTDFSTGLYPESIVTGDFNGDGILDLALPTEDALGSVSILLGAGGGKFQDSVDFPAGLLPVAIAAADFNDDGRLDAASANVNADSISSLLGTMALLSPTALTFPGQGLGTTSPAQNVTLTNMGGSPLSISGISTNSPFGETNNCGGSVSAGASCTLSVTFTPTIPGTENGTLTVSDNAVGSPQIVTLTGTGDGATVTLSPTSLNFGNQAVGTSSATQNVVVTNTGNETLTFGTPTISTGFSQVNNCSSVVPKGTCSFSVRFSPTQSGAINGTLTVTDNGYGSPQIVPLSGVGTQGVATFSPTSLNFGLQLLNTTSSPQTVTLMNTGNATLTIISVYSPPSFPETNNCGSSLTVGASCTFNVTFKPLNIGTLGGTMNVYDNGAGNPQTISVTGTSTEVSLIPASVNFGTVKVGETSSSHTVILTNVSTTKSVSDIAVSLTGSDPGDFAQTNNCGKSVAPIGICTFTLTFKPQAKGSRTASLSISDNGGTSPQTVPLSGKGD